MTEQREEGLTAEATPPVPSRANLVLLAALFIIGPFALQLFLPSLPAIQEHFDAEASVVALAVSLATVTYAFASLAHGGLADRLGRRSTALLGIGLLVVGSVICATAPNMVVLLVGRVVQVSGGAAGVVVARATIVDMYEGRAATRVMSVMFAVMTLTPILTFPLGGTVVQFVGWRGNFATVAVVAGLLVLALLLRFPETHGVVDGHAAPSTGMFTGCLRLMRSMTFVGFVLNHAWQMAATTTFSASVGLLLAEQHDMSATAIGFAYLPVAGMLAIGSYAAVKLPENAFRYLVGGAFLAVAAAVVGTVLAQSEIWTVSALLIPGAFVYLVFGLTGPSAQAEAVGAVPGLQGLASGILMFVGSLVTAVVVQIEASLSDGSPVVLMIVLVVCGVGGVLSLLLTRQGRTEPEKAGG
jgi:DHA1 family bicyclomycin/chloramphenicol resistance-like MFS transporter